MMVNRPMKRRSAVGLAIIFSLWANTEQVHGQGPGPRGGAAPAATTPKAGAPIDLTGYWVSIVSDDWRVRMFSPPRGEYRNVPLNALGRRVAEAWDPKKDGAAGEQCRSYGAPHLMRIPGRLHVTWQNDQVLTLETDAATQKRVFYFDAPLSPGGDWQGISQASWEVLPSKAVSTDGARLSFNGQEEDKRAGSLKVMTTKLRPGYLLKNGVPYSDRAILTEYFDVMKEPNGDTYLVVTTKVEDPIYLNVPFVVGTNFRKQADASGWNPTSCEAE